VTAAIRASDAARAITDGDIVLATIDVTVARTDLELLADVVDDLRRHPAIVLAEEGAVPTQHAELEREALWRVASPRQRRTSTRSSGESVQSRASSSSVTSFGRVGCMGSLTNARF
jgi:hypothetical protein